eukprot:TRINITY_DN3586_c0_g1_i1.p1 TRINITY_DN3586_c0_g1~~TRINITY_DN3586_c0_g1_i1.p1  ORF type:complete len:115 (-),score=5.76 TRINITY_DN3586_c0_g1_i1:1266-1610(-)
MNRTLNNQVITIVTLLTNSQLSGVGTLDHSHAQGVSKFEVSLLTSNQTSQKINKSTFILNSKEKRHVSYKTMYSVVEESSSLKKNLACSGEESSVNLSQFTVLLILKNLFYMVK